MKSLLIGYSILLAFGLFGVINILQLPTMSSGPYSMIIPPLNAADTDEVIAAKIKLSATHATIDPSLLLPLIISNK
jgi:hypothetical protein